MRARLAALVVMLLLGLAASCGSERIVTVAVTVIVTVTATPSATPTPIDTITAGPTTPTATACTPPTPTPTATATPTPTPTPTVTSTATGTATPTHTATVEPTPAPCLPGPIGEDYLSGMGIPAEDLVEIAEDPARWEEMLTLLMHAQYGDTFVSGRWRGYLKGVAPDIASMVWLFNSLRIGGGAATRDPLFGSARLWEDMYESLTAGPGTERPDDVSIADWRNLIYGGTGALCPGGILLGGPNVTRALEEPETLDEAQAYIDTYLVPLLGSTVTQGSLDVLSNLLPDLWIQFKFKKAGGNQLWAQWLRANGYLPSRAH